MRLRTEVSLVIEDDRITRIAAECIAPEKNDTLISLREYTVMPGLMAGASSSCHVRLSDYIEKAGR